MQVIEGLYVTTSAALILAGLTMVGMAIRAYLQTSRRAMVHLSLGFTLVVVATATTAISAFLNDFSGVHYLLLVNSGFTTCGYVFVVYSLVSYK